MERITRRFISIIAVDNGFALYTQVPGYSVNTGLQAVPDLVFKTQDELADWLAGEWKPSGPPNP